MTSEITFFGKTDFRGAHKSFGFLQNDRYSHCYILGKTGTGKTTLLNTLVRQDIMAGRGLALLDPHGDFVSELEAWIPSIRRNDVIYLNLPDTELDWGYNPLSRISSEKRPLVASGLMDVLKMQWGDSKSWGVKMEHILRNSILTLLDQPHATLNDIPRVLTDKSFRTHALKHIDNKAVSEFWIREFEAYSKASRIDAISPILNKIGGYLSNPVLMRFLVENKNTFRLRNLMDTNKILLVNLAQGKIGRDAANLCGSLLVTSLGLAGFSRADVSDSKRRPFFLYVDEFQNFSTSSFVSMLSELRKFRVGVIAANQYIAQLQPDIRNAVLGNAGTIISFRTGPQDARHMARELAPTFCERDIVNLPNYHFYTKLMIYGAPSKPFSAIILRVD